MVLSKKHKKYQHYYLEKFINMSFLQAKKYHGKTFEKQAKTMKNIYSGKINMYEADVDQTNQSIYYDISRSKTKESKDKKQNIIDRVNVFYEGWD